MQSRRNRIPSHILCGTMIVMVTLGAQGISHGADVTYDATLWNFGGNFEGASLGQDGYWFPVFDRVGSGNGDLPTDSEISVYPSYVTTQTFGTTVDGAGGYPYNFFTLPDGTSGVSGAIEMNNSPNGGNGGDQLEYTTLTFGPGVPSSLLVGVVADSSNSTVYSNREILVNGVSTGTLINNNSADVHYFQLDNVISGDTIQIDGVVSKNNRVTQMSGIVFEPIDSLIRATVERIPGQNRGSILISNTTASAIDILAYSVTSTSGALDQQGWTPITGNYDANGTMSIDTDPWTILSNPASMTDLSEAEFAGGNGGVIGVGETLDLGEVWIQGLLEDDIQVELLRADGKVQRLIIEYTGNGGDAFLRSDLDFDGDIDVNDWNDLKTGFPLDLSSLSSAAAYQVGDIDYSGDVDFTDSFLFSKDYDSLNGAGSFASMLSSVPEPGSILLSLIGLIGIAGIRPRRVLV